MRDWCTTSRRPFSELRRSYTTRFGPRGAHAKYFIYFWSLPYCRLSTIQDNRLTVLQILYTIWDQIPRFLKKVSFSQTLNGPFSIDTDPFRTSSCALERARAETSISAEFCIVRNPENPTPPRWSGLQISKIYLHYTVVLDNRLLLQYNKSVRAHTLKYRLCGPDRPAACQPTGWISMYTPN